MAKQLTRTGVVGLELTREEVVDLICKVSAVGSKAQCREVNCDIIDSLADIELSLKMVYNNITEILDSD